MKTSSIFLKGLAVAVTACIAFPAEGQITAADIYDMVGDNYSISSQIQQNDADIAARKASNRLQGAEIEFEHLWSPGIDTKWSLGITQTFDWPGVYGARRRHTEQSRVTAALGIEAMRQQLRYEASVLMVHIAFKQRRIDELNRMIADMEALDRYVSEALAGGLVTILDRKKVAIEITNLRIERDRTSAEQAEYIADLSQLANRPLADEKSIDWASMPVVTELQDYDRYLENLGNDRRISALKSSIRESEFAVDEAKMSSLPGFGIGYRHEKEEGEHFNGFAVTINLPTWGFSAAANAAKMQTVANEMQLSYLTKINETRVGNEYRQAVALRNNLSDLHRQGLDGSYLVLLKEAREGGEISMLDYLREVSWYRETTLNMLELEEQYSLILTSLNRYEN